VDKDEVLVNPFGGGELDAALGTPKVVRNLFPHFRVLDRRLARLA
jgi:hypothetical protein